MPWDNVDERPVAGLFKIINLSITSRRLPEQLRRAVLGRERQAENISRVPQAAASTPPNLGSSLLVEPDVVAVRSEGAGDRDWGLASPEAWMTPCSSFGTPQRRCSRRGSVVRLERPG